MANSIIIILQLIIIFCFIFPPTAKCSSNETDLLSLLAFKSSLEDPQGSLNSWKQTTHNFCNWTGIICGGRRHPDRVVEINLESQGLVGSLSPHLGNLSFLRAIILQNNSFHGPIPQEITLLRRLELVEFSNNSFSGAIPRNLSRCPNLTYLNLIDNNLLGNIPFELGSLPKLEALGLAQNNLSGHIPPSIGNITSLTKFSLAYCNLKGEIPESLSLLRNLKFLLLGVNNLIGTIPYGLFNISAIQYFEVPYNRLHGVIPSNIGLTLPKLRRLLLADNLFSGPIPVSISNASLLEYVQLQINNFTGPIPRVAGLTHLRDFTFHSNLIADDISLIISSLTNSTELKYLGVGYNLLTGSLPDSIANLSTHLQWLHLAQNKIHGKIPSGIGNLFGLTVFSLHGNYIEGTIPVAIGKLSNLQGFDLGANKFTNEIPSSFGNLTFLNSLYLYDNNLSGNVPSTLGNSTNLLALDISHNNFDGLIPPEIMSLSSISIVFNLSYNNFEGAIPDEVGSLTNLATLDLSNNRLSALIPNSLSRCMSLLQLYLRGNLLEGEIPSELSSLMGLQDLDVSRNNLSGSIPSFLGKLNLTNLNLSFNNLQGEVPIVGIFKNKTSVSVDGNRELCGGIPELKLPPCSLAKSQNKNMPTLLKVLIPILVVGGVCLLLLAFFTYKQRKSRKNVPPSVSSFTSVQFLRLSYADLLKSTDGFSEANLLGVGRFGSVYKGIILNDEQTLIAVKVLNLFVKGASKSFMTECNALRNIRHRNLLKILSACESIDFQGNDFKALVYEFKANGSLEKWLHHSKEEEGEQNVESNNLNMIKMLNIALDIAQAIEYLHFGTDSSIVHGDLKPSNILLDHEMTACVGDFGLAKIVSDLIQAHNESSSSIGIRGTLGYVPPEYGTTKSISPQGDVYSYGILLLEMFTNKRPTDDLFKDHVNVHNFVIAALPDRVMEIVDPRIRTKPDIKDGKMKEYFMVSILSIGVSCSKEMPRERMLMTDVVNELRRIQKLLSS